MPIRATVLADMEKKLTDESLKKEWDEHIEPYSRTFNQSGKPWEGETTLAQGDQQEGPAKNKRKLPAISEDMEALKKKKKQKLCVIPHSGGNLLIGANGMVWFEAGKEDAILTSQGPPLCLVYGTFKIGD